MRVYKLEEIKGLSEGEQKKFLERAYDLGFAYERDYHGCSQACLGALQELFGMTTSEDKAVFKACSGFAGGFGASGEGTCGALDGGCAFLSYLYGRERDKIQDPENMRFIAYGTCRRLMDKFRMEYGSWVCKDIQKIRFGKGWYKIYVPEEFMNVVNMGGHTTLAPITVGNAARWVAEIILEKETGKVNFGFK